MMFRVDEEDCQYGFEWSDAIAQDCSSRPGNLYVIYTRKMMS